MRFALMFHRLESLKYYVLILVAVFIILHTFIQPGVPATHDGNNQLARLANFYLVIEDKQIPPRWAPNLNYRFGYPVFHYNYYFPYIPGIVLYKLGFSLEDSYKLTTMLALAISGVFCLLFLKRYVSPLSAFTGAVLFVSAPPQLLQIFVRGNIGESWGWAVFVFGLWVIQQYHSLLHEDKKSLIRGILGILLSLAVAVLLLSHNVIFLLGLPVWLLFGVILYITSVKNHNFKARLIHTCIPFILGVGLGAYFLLPAFMELSLITLSNVGLTKDFADHFLYLPQLIWSSWEYGYSVKGWKDGMSFQLGLPHLLLIIAGIFLFVRYRKLQSLKETVKAFPIHVFFISILVISVVLMLEYSRIVWNLLPFLQKIQFPWRFLFLATFSLAVLGAFIVDKLKFRTIKILVVVVALLISFYYARPQALIHLEDYMYFEFPFTSSTNHENLPVGFDMNKNSEFNPRLAILDGDAVFSEKIWKSNKHVYSVEATKASQVVEHVAYFPGWKTYVDGHEVQINAQAGVHPGVITFLIEPGRHEVLTQLTEDTPARRWGNSISLVSLIIMVGYGSWFNGFSRKRTH